MSIKGENNGKPHFSQEVFRKRILSTACVYNFCRDKNRLIYSSLLPLKIFPAFTKSLGTYRILWLSIMDEFQ